MPNMNEFTNGGPGGGGFWILTKNKDKWDNNFTFNFSNWVINVLFNDGKKYRRFYDRLDK